MNEIHNFKIPISGTEYEPERMELTMSQAHTIARGRARQHKDREVRLYCFNTMLHRWWIVYGIQVQPRNKADRPHGLLATA